MLFLFLLRQQIVDVKLVWHSPELVLVVEIFFFLLSDFVVIFSALFGLSLRLSLCNVFINLRIAGLRDERLRLLVVDVAAASQRHVCKDLADVLLPGVHAAHISLEVVLLIVIFALVGLGIFLVLAAFVKLAVPDLLDLLDLVLAEALPRCHLTTLLSHLTVTLHVSGAIAGRVVNGLLGDVAELKRDLNDLAHVHARSLAT